MTVAAVIYRAPHMRQLVSSDPNGKYNCSAVALARATNAATLGAVRVTGKQVRALSNEPTPNPRSPGLNISQLVAVARTLRVPIYDRTGQTWEQMWAYLDLAGPGHRVLAQFDYPTLDGYRCQMGGDFDHMMTLDALRRHDGRQQILGSDPLCSGLRWYPASIIRDAMQEFSRETGLGGTRLRFAVTRAIPLIAKVS